MNMQGIYRVIISGKSYIGSTKNYEARISDHRKKLEENRHDNKSMQYEYNNSLFADFEFLRPVHKEIDLSLWECYYIGKFDSLDNGYNNIIAKRKGWNEWQKKECFQKQ